MDIFKNAKRIDFDFEYHNENIKKTMAEPLEPELIEILKALADK